MTRPSLRLARVRGRVRGAARAALRHLRRRIVMHRLGLQCAAAAMLIATATVGLTYVTWEQLADTRVSISRAPATAEEHTTVLTRTIVTSPPSRSRYELRAQIRAPQPQPAADAGSAGPTVLSGTKVATVMTGGLLAAATELQRRLLRRLRRRRAAALLDTDPPAPASAAALPASTEDDDAAEGTEATEEVSEEADSATESASEDLEGADADEPRPAAIRLAVPHPEEHALRVLTPPPAPASRPGSLASDTGYRVVLFDRDAVGGPVELRARARLQWPGHDVACFTERISLEKLTCAYEAGDGGSPPVGAHARVTLLLNGALAPLSARVTWSRPSGDVVKVGLQLEPLQDAHRMLIEAAVRDARKPAEAAAAAR